jgi:hypothetical protein
MLIYDCVIVDLLNGGYEQHKGCYGVENDAGLVIIEEATGNTQGRYSREQYLGWRNRKVR